MASRGLVAALALALTCSLVAGAAGRPTAATAPPVLLGEAPRSTGYAQGAPVALPAVTAGASSSWAAAGSAATSVPATSLRVNTSSRAAVKSFYNTYYKASEGIAAGWTGKVTGCSPGTTTATFQTATLRRINFFRAMAGVPATVTFNSTLSKKAQRAALMMAANQALSHFPPTGWKCYAKDGAEAAGNSNLSLGQYGPAAVSGQVQDPGQYNGAAGHRRWLLFPPTRVMGTGDTDYTQGWYVGSNSVWVFDYPSWRLPRPATQRAYVAWPPPGFVPYQLVWQRWSFSYPSADFRTARVSLRLKSGGTALPVTKEAVENGYGDNTLVWRVGGSRYPSAVSAAGLGQAEYSESLSTSRAFWWQAAAAIPAATAAAGGSLTSESGGVLGWLKWMGYQALGAVLALPMSLELLVRFITNPRGTLYRKNRNKLVYPDPLPGLTHEFFEAAAGIRLHAVRTSKGSGKPLMLMVHGFPEAWFSWRHQMDAFRGEYEVVAIDMRGYGDSSRPQGRAPYRMPELVGDVVAVARHLLVEAGQEQLVLVGHDWGANVCWGAAATSPHLFARLAILCVPHPARFLANMDWDQFRRSWYIFAFQVPFIPEWYCRMADSRMLELALTKPPMGCATPGAVPREYIERYKQAFGRPGAATALINYYRGAVDLASRYPAPALQAALRRPLRVPTLLLWGECDTALGQQLLRGTERHVERLRVHVLKGCSHWAQQDQPQEVNRLLKEFLASP